VAPISGRDVPLLLGQLSLAPADQIKIQQKQSCPPGYVRSPGIGQDSHVVVCEVDRKSAAFNFCSARPGFYSCGRSATECCSVRQDNSCFSGAFACSAPTTLSNPIHTACCVVR
jgi:hypothetical protein